MQIYIAIWSFTFYMEGSQGPSIYTTPNSSLLSCGHIYHLPAKFLGQNPNRNSHNRQLTKNRVDQKKTKNCMFWLLVLSCALYISMLLTMDACKILLKFSKCDCNFNRKPRLDFQSKSSFCAYSTGIQLYLASVNGKKYAF